MLDEKSLRRPEFSDGYAVKLCDGQEWVFPKPKMRFIPRVKPDGSVDIGGKTSFGPESDKLLEAMFGIGTTDGYEILRAKFEMAVRLLMANYNLKPEDFPELIAYDPEDDADNQLWDELSPVLMGRAPGKPSAGGSDSAP
jgi:hypothetical protein